MGLRRSEVCARATVAIACRVEHRAEWEGPHPLDYVKKTLTRPTDYGVYQIYGGHPVYGGRALLYIGLAQEQPFGIRIPQQAERWRYTRDPERVEVHVGRLAGTVTPNAQRWNELITWVERILIRAHMPAYNSQMYLGELQRALENVHVLNWGNHRDLLPEVSGARWTARFTLSEMPGYHAFGEQQLDH